MLEDAVRRRLKVLIASRAAVVTLLFGTFYLLRIGDLVYSSYSVFPYVITALYVLTILYALALKWIKTLTAFTVIAYIQLILDVIFETVFVYLTGGVESWLTFTFLLTIISSSIVLNRRASYSIASLCSILYGLLMEFQFYYNIPTSSGIPFSSEYYFYKLFTHIIAFFLMAFLSGNLSERLRIAVRTLRQQDTYIDHLKALSRDIIESMPSGIFTTDLNWKIATLNTTALKITGRSSSDIIGKTPQDVFPFLRDIHTPFERIEGQIQSGDRLIFIGIRLSTLKNSMGVPIGMIGVFQDVTNVKEMEAEIQKKEKWAFIGELSASIAHELRNPLASLKASVEMLREKRVSEHDADHLMKIAITEMERLNAIITDFLIYARPRQPHKETFDLHRSLGDLVILLRNSAGQRGDIEVTGNFEGELLIAADAKQMQQVFWNLGANAIESITGSGLVAISAQKKNNTVEITFEDTGTGIRREDMDRIFYPFFTSKEQGTGLGLSIAQRIVEEHGGVIKVYSKGVGRGTTFRVLLPLEIAGVENLYGESHGTENKG